VNGIAAERVEAARHRGPLLGRRAASEGDSFGTQRPPASVRSLESPTTDSWFDVAKKAGCCWGCEDNSGVGFASEVVRLL